jgi:hypothetical protein
MSALKLQTGISKRRGGGRPARNRGSRRRLKRVTLRGNWSIELIVFVIWVLVLLFVLVPRMIQHPHQHRPVERLPSSQR